MVTVLRAFAVALPFFTFMMMVLWATQGFQTVTYAAYVQQMIRPALYLLLLPVFYFIGAGLVGVVAAYGLSMLLGSLVAVYFLHYLFSSLLDSKVEPKYETKALFSVSIPMSVTTGAQYLNTWSAIWVLGFFAAGDAGGNFSGRRPYRDALDHRALRFLRHLLPDHLQPPRPGRPGAAVAFFTKTSRGGSLRGLSASFWRSCCSPKTCWSWVSGSGRRRGRSRSSWSRSLSYSAPPSVRPPGCSP